MKISQAEIKEIIAKLDAEMLKADDSLYDSMESVRRDLLKIQGDVDALPHEGKLREWGLLETMPTSQVEPETSQGPIAELPAPPTSPVGEPDTTIVSTNHSLRGAGQPLPGVSAILASETLPLDEQEKQLLSEKISAYQSRDAALGASHFKNIRTDVANWLKAKTPGPLPHAEELETLGIWPPEARVVSRELGRISQMLVNGVPKDEIFTALDKLVARIHEPEQQARVNEKRGQVESALAQADVENLMREVEQFNFDVALRKLQTARVLYESQSARDVFDLAEKDIKRMREKELAARLKNAEDLDKNSSDIKARSDAWDAVLALNPGNSKAEKALVELVNQKNISELKRELGELIKSFEIAEKEQDIQKYYELRGSFEQLASSLERADNKTDAKDARKALENFLKSLNNLREKLGILPTNIENSELKSAYVQAKKFFDENIPYIRSFKYNKETKSREPSVSMMPMDEAIEHIRNQYVDFLKNTIHAKAKRVDDFLKNEPRKALTEILSIRDEYISESKLDKDDIQLLSGEKNLLDQMEADQKNAVKRYEDASALFQKAQEEHYQGQEDELSRLVGKFNLLKQAEKLFPTLPGLEESIHRNENARKIILENKIRTELEIAWQYAVGRKYADAKKCLNAQRALAEGAGGEVYKEYLALGTRIAQKEQDEKDQEARERKQAAREAQERKDALAREDRERQERQDREERQRQAEKERMDDLERLASKEIADFKEQVKSKLEEYDYAGGTHILEAIGKLFEGIEKKYPERFVALSDVKVEWLNRHSSSELLDKAEKAYASKQWKDAESFFLQIRNPASQIQQRLQRAQAAVQVEAAKEAYKNKDYANAERMVKIASAIFFGEAAGKPGVDSDNVTRTLALELPDLLASIKGELEQKRAEDAYQEELRREKEQNDLAIAIREAEMALKARERQEQEEAENKKYQERAARVLRNAEYVQEEVNKTLASRKPSDLYSRDFHIQETLDELEAERKNNRSHDFVLGQAAATLRDSWRELNLLMMREAIRAREDAISLDALKKVMTKADLARSEGFFVDGDDITLALYAGLKARVLDREYKKWFVGNEDDLPINITWATVKENRSARLDVETERWAFNAGEKRKAVLGLIEQQLFALAPSDGETQPGFAQQLQDWKRQLSVLPGDVPNQVVLDKLEQWLEPTNSPVYETNHRDFLQALQQEMDWLKVIPDKAQKEQTIKSLEAYLRKVTENHTWDEAQKYLKEKLKSASNTDTTLKDVYAECVEHIQAMPGALTSEFLLRNIVEIAWKGELWQEALSLAQNFNQLAGSTARENHDIVVMLTNLARAYAEDRPEDGQAFLPKALRIREKESGSARSNEQATQVPFSGENKAYIIKMESIFRAKAVERLLAQARACLAQDVSDSEAQATYIFALAYRYDPKNEAVEAGLKPIWARAGAKIKDLCAEADNLTFRGKAASDLLVACQEGNALLQKLESYINITNTNAVALSSEQKTKLSDAIQKLQEKVRAWRSLHEELVSYEGELKKALFEPVITGLDENDPGNSKFWDVERLRNNIGTLLALYNKMSDSDGQSVQFLLEAKKQERVELENHLKTLNKAVAEFRIALDRELFELIPDKARALDSLWTAETRREPRLSGLEKLIVHSYHEPFGERDTPYGHADVAREQKANWQAWKTWSEDVVNQNQAMLDLEAKLGLKPGGLAHSSEENRLVEMQKTLEEIKNTYSLVDVMTICKELESSAQILLATLNNRPKNNEPNSDRADRELEKIKPSEVRVKERAELVQNLVKSLHDAAQAQRETLVAPLAKLKNYMETTWKKNIGKSQFKNILIADVEKLLKPCLQIDAFDKEVKEINREYRSKTS